MENNKKYTFEIIKKFIIFTLYLLIFCGSAFLSWFVGFVLGLFSRYEGALLSNPFFFFTMVTEIILFTLNYLYLDKVYKNKYKIFISLFCTFFIVVIYFAKYS